MEAKRVGLLDIIPVKSTHHAHSVLKQKLQSRWASILFLNMVYWNCFGVPVCWFVGGFESGAYLCVREYVCAYNLTLEVEGF